MTPGRHAEFRALHHAAGPLLLPNAWDFASAAALADAGFAAIGTTSLGVAAAAGRPDGHGATLDETLRLARAAVRLPCSVTVDLEGGFGGGPAEVAALAEELAGMGVAGINLEDGRPDGSLTDVAAQVEVIGAIKSRVPSLFVNARTDAFWLAVADPLPEALLRSAAFARAGADGVFAPGIATDDDISVFVAESALPVNVLFLPGRHTVAGLAALGVRRVSLGSLLFRAALHTTVRTAEAVGAGRPIDADIPGYADVVSLIGQD
jgi:2-methylisocitrate lyase-like PEP mutase family enzyme